MTPSPGIEIDNATARRLFMARQGLSQPVGAKLDCAGLQTIIDDLGFVQVDSINTVARAHHMILFARNQTYRPALLSRLLERDRTVFEHWTHDAAIIPTAFYPYWHHRFDRERRFLLKRWRKWRREGFEDALDHVLAHVRETGPTMSRDLGPRDLGQGIKKPSGGWWDWHPEKTALEFHWRTGELAICRREGFQKVYDLSERVIPDHRRKKDHPDEAAFIDWACRSALQRLGAATSGEVARFWDLITPKEAAAWCAGARSRGDIIGVSVAPWADGELGGGGKPGAGGKVGAAFALPDVPDALETLPEPLKRVRVLSPFDPMIRDRKRCLRLFGFDYRIEVFVPAAQRTYGYYVFPLLEGARFIGRIDMKHIRERDALEVYGLWMEPGVKLTKGRRQALEAELDRHRKFVGASRVDFPDAALK